MPACRTTSGAVASVAATSDRIGVGRGDLKSRATIARLAIVVLLVWAAYWAALPWIDCMRAFVPFAGLQGAVDLGLSGCTFGFLYTGPRTPGALYPDLVVAALYLVAGLWVAFRAHFD